MKKTTYEYCSTHVDEFFNGVTPNVYQVISEGLEVHYGNISDINVDYCNEHHIPYYNLQRAGGAIVCTSDTIGYATITDIKFGWLNSKFLNAFLDFLRDKGLNPLINGNDILLDNHKVASAAEKCVLPGYTKVFGVYLISYDVPDLEIMNNICVKKMNKIPKALKDFGIDKNELLNWLDTYFNNLVEVQNSIS